MKYSDNNSSISEGKEFNSSQIQKLEKKFNEVMAESTQIIDRNKK